MMQGDFHGVEGLKAGRDFRGAVLPWCFETPPPHCKTAIDDILAETQCTQYVLNFGGALMKDGITRTVNRLVEEDQ